jgi:DNA-binding transcriptional LysR family regulator
MDFRDIKYFVRLSDEKSITRAAQKLFITQQGLSKAILKLETELGFPLFERQSSGVQLTRQGHIFRQYALEFQNLHTRAQTGIAHLRRDTQSIRIGVSMGVILSIPPGQLELLCEALEPVKLEFFEMMDYACEDAVEREEMDFGITLSPIAPARFVAVPLKQRPMVAVIHTDNPLAALAEISFEALRGESFIIANQNFKPYHNFIARCKAHGFTPNITGTTMDMIVICNKSSQKQGIGISADMPVSNISYPDVVLVPFALTDFPWQINLITPAARPLTERELHIRGLLVKYLAD